MSPARVILKFPRNVSITAVLAMAAIAILFVLIVWFLYGYNYGVAPISVGTMEGLT